MQCTMAWKTQTDADLQIGRQVEEAADWQQTEARHKQTSVHTPEGSPEEVCVQPCCSPCWPSKPR